MEKLIQSIIDYLNCEDIQIDYFNQGGEDEFLIEQPTELAIRIDESKKENWEYFTGRLNECSCGVQIAKGSYYGGIYKFIFNGTNSEAEKSVLEENLQKFLETLKKKYYLVNPRVGFFSVLVKPTHRCNLDCKYCYDKPFRDAIKCDMSMEVLDRFVKLLSEYAGSVQFIWHGGEPTMVGTEWYEKAQKEVFSKYPMTNFEFHMMSNGVALNDEWFGLFDKYKIQIGMSYNSIYQEKLRVSSQFSQNQKRDGELSKKLENILRERKIGVIDVITKKNYKDQIKIYNYYKDLNNNFAMNHIFHTAQTEKNDLELEGKEYAKEFLKYFKYWLHDRDGINERAAEEMLKHVIGCQNVTCQYADCRRKWLGLNPIGELYPCDRYFPDKYKIGSVFDFNNVEEIFESEAYQLYVREIQERFDNKCKPCGYWFACHGGCNGSAVECTGSAAGVEEFACEMFRLQFNGVYDIIRDIDIIHDTDLNPYARNVLIENGFYSVKDIKKYMEETGGEYPELIYDPDNLLECSEYQIFRGINYIRNGAEVFSRHTDIINSLGSDEMLKNEQMRRKDIHDYLREVAMDVFRPKAKDIEE